MGLSLQKFIACTSFRVSRRLKQCVTWPHTCSPCSVETPAPRLRTSRRSSPPSVSTLTMHASTRSSMNSVERTLRNLWPKVVLSLPQFPLVVVWLLPEPVVLLLVAPPPLKKQRKRRKKSQNPRMTTWASVSLTKSLLMTLTMAVAGQEQVSLATAGCDQLSRQQ